MDGLLEKLQGLNNIFKVIGNNLSELSETPSLPAASTTTPDGPQTTPVGKVTSETNKIQESTLKEIKDGLGKLNLDVSNNEIIKGARDQLYVTLEKTVGLLNGIPGSVKERDKFINDILKYISFVKASILTAPQIDNPIRHGFSTIFTYEDLLINYPAVESNTVLGLKVTEKAPLPPPAEGAESSASAATATVPQAPTAAPPAAPPAPSAAAPAPVIATPTEEAKTVNSVFSEKITKIANSGNVTYQIRDNLASFTIGLSYNNKNTKTELVALCMPHYIGDETTIPTDLQIIFKYVFWFQQKFRTCDLPFFPSVLTMIKMNIVDEALESFIKFLMLSKQNETLNDVTLPKDLSTEKLIKWIKYLEHYFGEYTKKLDTFPSILEIAKELNNIKKKMIETNNLITTWASKTYTALYEKIGTKAAADTAATEKTANEDEFKIFSSIIYYYKQSLENQSKTLFEIIFSVDTLTTTPTTSPTTPPSGTDIIQSNIKRIAEEIDKLHSNIEKLIPKNST